MNSNVEDVLNFVKRRFHEDNHWVDGNCYWAAWILCERFPWLSMYYCPIIGHFVAGDGERFFDGHGLYECTGDPILLKDIELKDPLWFGRLIRDCRN